MDINKPLKTPLFRPVNHLNTFQGWPGRVHYRRFLIRAGAEIADPQPSKNRRNLRPCGHLVRIMTYDFFGLKLSAFPHKN